MCKKQFLVSLLVSLFLQAGFIPQGMFAAQAKSDQIQQIKDNIDATKKDADVQLFGMVGDFLAGVKIPNELKGIFNKDFSMRNLKIIQGIPSSPVIRSGIGFTGTLSVMGSSVKGTMYVVLDKNFRKQFMLIIDLPERYKLSQWFPKLKRLDPFAFSKMQFIVSTFEFYDQDQKAKTEANLKYKGVHFKGLVEPTGPLNLIGKMKKAAKNIDGLVVESGPINLWGMLFFRPTAQEMQSVGVFGAIIPIRLGIDFTKVPRLPKAFSNIFKSLTSDDYELKLVVLPKLSMSVEAGVRLTLGTQKEPLRMSWIGEFEPQSLKLKLGRRIRGMLDLKWLALGNAGTQMIFDFDLMVKLGVPFTGFGYNGEIDVGKKGKSRAVFKVAKLIELKDDAIPSILSEISAENVRFDDVVALLLQMAQKAKVLKQPFPKSKIPIFRLNTVRGYAAIDDAKIANTFYKAGFHLTLDGQFLDQKLLLDVKILHKDLKMSGVGYLSNIDLKIKGKPIFKLTGPGLDQKEGTKDDGPVVFCSANAFYPLDTTFGVRGKFEVPALGLNAKIDLVYMGTNLKADMEMKFPGFTGIFQTYINPLNAKDMFIKLGFKKDFDNFLSTQIKTVLKKLKKDATKKLDDLNKKNAELIKQQKTGSKKSEGKIDKKIQEKQKAIAQLKKEIKTLQAQRKKAGVAEKIKITAKIAKKQAALKLDEAQLLVLKPGKIVTKIVTVTAQITKELNAAKLLQKTAQKALNSLERKLEEFDKVARLVQVKEAAGSYSAKDIAAGKLPRLDRLMVKTNFPGMPSKVITLKNVQFDFKDATKATYSIAKSILKTANII